MSEANTLLANVRIGMRRLGERRRSRAKEMRAARAPASAVEVNNMGGNPWCDLCGEAGGRVGGGRWWACWPGGMDPCAYATAACALMCAPNVCSVCSQVFRAICLLCERGVTRVGGPRTLGGGEPGGPGPGPGAFPRRLSFYPVKSACVELRRVRRVSGVIRGLS